MPSYTPLSRAHDEGDARGVWHAREAADVARELESDTLSGLSSEEVTRRRARHGENRLAEAAPEPMWRKLLRLLRDPLTIVLAVAALVSALVSREWKTPVVILAVVVFNTVLNLAQERRAEESLALLRKLTVTRARVRRDARTLSVDATELVPGDIVLVDAGDVVPADGRIVDSVALEVQESAFTGEAVPVSKTVTAEIPKEAGLADRVTMLFTSTFVTRGHARFVVTETGMDTEIGRIATLIRGTERTVTPLQKQIDGLARLLTRIALAVVGVVFAIGLLRGHALSELFLTAVSLAVATIPEGLSAVVAFTLAMGASRLAKQGAIVKSLAAVETLGSTAHICTDKTGTLTLNQMTARYLLSKQRLFEISGEGYSTDGEIIATDRGSDGRPLAAPVPPVPDVREALAAMAMCSDASVEDGVLVGDPTEGALVVLAKKAGLDVEAARALWHRAAEVPFASEHKYMATFHRWAELAETDPESNPRRWGRGLAPPDLTGVRLMVKGAPDVVISRSTELGTPEGVVELDEGHRERLSRLIRDIGSQGLRVMALAQRDLADGDVDFSDVELLRSHVQKLRLLALVAIEDPPRAEAKEAIATAREAGITVHMITGDHVGTASAVAERIGIRGEALSGADLDALDDAALAARAPGIGVLARVSPEHKLRTVRALQSSGAIVAMTGDGVNDAPALKQADIGVAMGITGTEVSKGAAVMILTDDNFATIVAAIRQGRGIYANIVKFVKFQLCTAWAFVGIFLVTAVPGVAEAAPFTALQILWVNIIMDGPPALALGLDPTPERAMRDPPRPVGQGLLTRERMLRILFGSLVMVVGTLAVLLNAPSGPVGPSLVFTTFVFFQVFNLLNVHSDASSVFSRYTLRNGWIWLALVSIVILQVLAVHVAFLQSFFATAALTPSQWLIAAAVGSSILWVDEARKLIGRMASVSRANRG